MKQEKPKKPIGRPPLKKRIPRANIMIRLPDFITEKVDKLAYERRLSRTRTIEEIIEKYFEGEESK